jgi:hypothetical protein
MINKYGLDTDYIKTNIAILLRDADRYKPDEMARALLRLSIVADSKVISEEEFKVCLEKSV